MTRIQAAERKGTDCFKWDLPDTEYTDPEMQQAAKEAIPMWIADMDFQAPAEVQEALARVVQHGVYGYTGRTDRFFEAIQSWLLRRHGWDVPREWLDFSPGVLPGISACVNAFTQPGDKVIIQPPVYYPFFNIVRNNGRQLVENKLRREGVCYTMDLDDLEEKAADPQAKMLILCSPHNPVGRVWTEAELRDVYRICSAHHVLVVSDEIHSDLILGERRHIPYGTVDTENRQNWISFYAPSKTFNLAGLQTSAAVIPNPQLHDGYKAALRNNQTYSATRFGIEAFQAAYRYGEPYLEELLTVLRQNYTYLKTYLEKHLPQIHLSPLEGTYLAWMDFRDCGVPVEELEAFLLKKAGIMMDYGSVFSEDYMGFARMNLACPQATIQTALEQLRHALEAV